MKVLHKYPGDPDQYVEFLYGRDFTERFPKREIRIMGFNDSAADTVIPVAEVVCDVCNALVKPLDPCVLAPGYLYCWSCAKESVIPHCVVEGMTGPRHDPRSIRLNTSGTLAAAVAEKIHEPVYTLRELRMQREPNGRWRLSARVDAESRIGWERREFTVSAEAVARLSAVRATDLREVKVREERKR